MLSAFSKARGSSLKLRKNKTIESVDGKSLAGAALRDEPGFGRAQTININILPKAGSLGGAAPKGKEAADLTQEQLIRSMAKVFSKQNRNQPVDFTSAHFESIYSKICQYDRNFSKVKLNKTKVSKAQIKSFL